MNEGRNKILELVRLIEKYDYDGFSVRIDDYKILLVLKHHNLYIYWVLLEGYSSSGWFLTDVKRLNSILISEVTSFISEIKLYTGGQIHLSGNSLTRFVYSALIAIFSGDNDSINISYIPDIDCLSKDNPIITLKLKKSAFGSDERKGFWIGKDYLRFEN